MAKVPNAVEILPKIWTAWVGRTNVTDDRQTTLWQTTDGRAIAYSEREREFTFTKMALYIDQLVRVMNDIAWRHQQFCTIYLGPYLFSLVAVTAVHGCLVVRYVLAVYTGRFYRPCVRVMHICLFTLATRLVATALGKSLSHVVFIVIGIIRQNSENLRLSICMKLNYTQFTFENGRV